MSDSFAQFLARLHSQNDAAAQELFARFTGRLLALARGRFSPGLRHKVDSEYVDQSVFKSFFLRYGDAKLDVVNWNSRWALLTVITMRKYPSGSPITGPSASCRGEEAPGAWRLLLLGSVGLCRAVARTSGLLLQAAPGGTG